MQSKKHCNFLVHYQLLWQKCNLFVDNWLPYKLARYVYSSNSIAPIPIELTQHPLSVTKPPCTQCWHMMIFELLSQETNMNMWQEGSILPVRINQPNLVSPSSPFPTPGALWQSSNPNKLGRRPDGLRHMSHPCWRQRVYFQVGDVLSAQQLLVSSLNKSDHNDLSSRIKAVNKSSKGHWNYSIPSEPSDSMIAKIRYSEKSSTTCFMLPPMITIASFTSEQYAWFNKTK